MNNCILFVLFAFGLWACGGSGSGPSAADIEKGKELYTTYCIACHGPDGKLMLNGAKDFAESTMSLDERILIITKGRNMMTAFGSLLKEEEIKQVAAYTIKLSKGE